MFPTRVQYSKKNLLLCFDAFGTLFKPNVPIPQAYAEAALRHGIKCNGSTAAEDVGREFKRAFKEVSKQHPNYGKATGLGAEKWWRNVINSTFTPWLEPNQSVPQSLVDDLLHRYSTKQGYTLFPDILPFFHMLRSQSQSQSPSPSPSPSPRWPWHKTTIGIITNSDARVPSILTSFGLHISPRRVGTRDARPAHAAQRDDIAFVVLSYDVGVEKPGRGIFDAAVALARETLADGSEGEAGLEGWDRVYVGDSLEQDVVGAMGAGWRAVRLDRGGGGGVRVVREMVEGGREIEVVTIGDLGALGALGGEGWRSG